VGDPLRRRLGGSGHGLALRCTLWLLVGTMRMDHHRRNLANLAASLRNRNRSLVELDEQLVRVLNPTYKRNTRADHCPPASSDKLRQI